eukprot:NODE_449_length_1489_cov_104.867107_g417_i0.p1 GENE.NODE_449_length_1489_cov_104.867107_g417_i0~~NODE_449_length_1489_cov_104.867107_g417_i0.p1  ORF type:complete len:427 (-),score=71.17 NODE_449_length_1489_cov_104.867107_g417_i0:129-1409(-)
MVASAVYILDAKGKVLISRNYRGDIPSASVEKFIPLVLEDEEDSSPPVLEGDGVHYVYIRHNNLYILALTRKNSNVMTIIVYLHKLKSVFEDYFKDLQEESIRDNFVIIYELFDEMMDFGYPQITEAKILQEYITQESNKLEIQRRPPNTVTNAVSWRSEGIKYKKNEVFLDVVESVNMVLSPNGNVVRSEIIGALKMRTFLSGMPELRLGLNDKVRFEATKRSTGNAIDMEDVKFHQCVRLSRFETDRTISFIPPDGEFELMSYRLTTAVKPLILCESTIDDFGTRMTYKIKASAVFKSRLTAQHIEIVIPVPEDATGPKFKASIGNVKYAPERNAIVWSIKQFSGGKEFLLRSQFALPSIREPGSTIKLHPISVKFEIPYYTTSGIQVRYLKIVERSGYQSHPWVRYVTQNGDYSIRTSDPIIN